MLIHDQQVHQCQQRLRHRLIGGQVQHRFGAVIPGLPEIFRHGLHRHLQLGHQPIARRKGDLLPLHVTVGAAIHHDQVFRLPVYQDHRRAGGQIAALQIAHAHMLPLQRIDHGLAAVLSHSADDPSRRLSRLRRRIGLTLFPRQRSGWKQR